jgi:hypothetical protein
MRIDLLYALPLDERHTLIPSVEAGTYDADGGAMTRTGAGLHLTHSYRDGRYGVATRVGVRQTRFDKSNPLFGEKQKEEEMMLSITGTCAEILDIPGLSGAATLLYASRDDRIAFYEAEASMISLGVRYDF